MPTFELLGERESEPTRVVPCDDGEAVPDVESFFLDDLSLSFVLDSCSCWTVVSGGQWKCLSWGINKADPRSGRGKQGLRITHHSLPKTLHIETPSR